MIINIPNEKLTKTEKLLMYMRINHNDYISVEGIHSDETEMYLFPNEPEIGENVTFKLRTMKNNVDNIYLCIGDNKFLLDIKEGKGYFDYYSYVYKNIENTINYYYIIEKDGAVYYYNKQGLNKDINIEFNFKVIPNFKTPKWAKGAVMYQIYVDRFNNGDKTNDVVDKEYLYQGRIAKQMENWDSEVEADDICNFYGGDLQGVMDKLDYLKDLGVDCIYFNPIFVSPSNHKYDIQDYDYIDPHYGKIIEDDGAPLTIERFHNKFASKYVSRTTSKENLEASNDFMIKLVEKAHEKGIKVILDGVFNHCGAFNKWLDKEGFYRASGYPDGAYREKNSQYHDYFKWYDDNWPNNDCYDSWWGHDNHPKLNFEQSQELYDYIIEVGKKWVSPPFNCDGWRLDVGADLGYSLDFNHKFWKDFRNGVKTANKDAIILAEHYGDPQPWLLGNEWDTIMNYDAFMEPLTWFLTGMEKHSEAYKPDMENNSMAFENAMRYYMSKFSVQSLQTSMNQLSNHDHSRFLTRTNKKVGRLHTVGKNEADTGININTMMEAVTFQMMWPGAPTLYYGDEAGVTGWTDPDNRRPYPWGNENKMLLQFHKEVIKIHKEHSAIKDGSIKFLNNQYGLITFARWNNDDKVIVVINNNDCEKKIVLPVWKVEIKENGILEELIKSGNNTFEMSKCEYKVANGFVELFIQPKSSVIYCEK